MLIKSAIFSNQRRLFSDLASKISQIPNGSSDITNDLREIPTSTGSGPFIEYPTFEPIGPSSSLLNVKLPASSVLNLRSNSVIAANGELCNVFSKLKVLNLWTKPLIYNEISATSPISLVLSNSDLSFINLQVQNEPWYVLNSNNLEAWYGDFVISSNLKLPGLKIESVDSYRKNLVLNGKGQLFTVKLDKDENISLNLSSIVGFTGGNGTFVKRSIDPIGIPRFGFIDTLKTQYKALSKIINPGPKDSVDKSQTVKEPLKEDKALVELNENSWINTYKDWLLTKFNNIKYKNKLFYQIQGPAIIIVQNQTSSISKTFTTEQLQTIYNQLK